MTRLILDPGLFELSDRASEMEQMEYVAMLQDTIVFSANHFLEPFLDCYDGAPYFKKEGPPFQSPPLTKSPYVINVYSRFKKTVTALIRRGQLIRLDNEVPVKCDLNVPAQEEGIPWEPFQRYLGWLSRCNIQEAVSVLLLSVRNQDICSPVVVTPVFSVHAVYRPAIDCHQIVAGFLKPIVHKNAMFPRIGDCEGLNTAFMQEKQEKQTSCKQTSTDFFSLYEKYGRETASRNEYRKDDNLTKKNKNNKCCMVFKHQKGRFFLSIDREHGGLEVFSNQILTGGGKRPSYTHLGEYDFSCDKQKDADTTSHKLYF